MTLLLANGADINARDSFGQTSLFHEAGAGNPDAVEFLLSKGADANAANFVDAAPLLSAITPFSRNGDSAKIVKLLLDAGAKKETIGGTQRTTALIDAAEIGDTDAVSLLLDRGANKEVQDALNVYGRNDPFPINHATALIHAAWKGQTDAVKLLLKAGADKDATDHWGHTALKTAEYYKHTNVVEFLRAYKADVHAEDNRLSDAAGNPQPKTFSSPPTNWPSYSGKLTGLQEVRVKNPNDFKVRVGLRSEGKGKDFIVSPNGTESVNVPDGQYEVYFNYSSDPDGLYQGDSFTLKDNGAEITITKVVNGNYGIRKVK